MWYMLTTVPPDTAQMADQSELQSGALPSELKRLKLSANIESRPNSILYIDQADVPDVGWIEIETSDSRPYIGSGRVSLLCLVSIFDRILVLY